MTHQTSTPPSPPRTDGARETLDSPWITAATWAPPASARLSATTDWTEPPEVALTGPSMPHAAVPAPPPGSALPCHLHRRRARVWWLGVHGGSGESTLNALMEGSRTAEHAWPDLRGDPAPVVLVARTTAHGLERARIAATQWAASSTPAVRLLGLVIVADAPGRLPPPLHDLVKLTRGAVPRTWHVPWIEALRLGVEAAAISQPRSLRRLLSDVTHLTDSPALEGALHV